MPESAIVTPETEKRRAILTKLNGRIVPSDGRFHPHLAAQYVTERDSRWIETGELAKTFYFSNTETNRRRIRHNMFRIMHAVQDRNRLLIVETDPREGHKRCKVCDPRVIEERQMARRQIDRLEKMKVLKVERLDRARELLALLEQAV